MPIASDDCTFESWLLADYLSWKIFIMLRSPCPAYYVLLDIEFLVFAYVLESDVFN